MSDPSTTVITVAGTHRVHRHPERAVVRIAVGYDGDTRDSVLAATRAAHESLTGSLESLSAGDGEGPVRRWHSEDIRVWGQRPWAPDGTRLPVEFHSAVAVDAEFDDFGALSEWIDVVAARDGVTVEGVDWSLTPDSDAALRQEARKGAVADAVAKAGEYADALGLRQPVATALADAGLLDAAGAGGDGAPRLMSAMAKHGGSPGGVELRPAEVVVEAAVHARFTATAERS
ncbi:SIMPL domain-containing protein [Herbiconiux moechotypicola]|uniref:SIMPL domain-containing protein n=1 Tax=Herbiconiux moechotypicola TaxID=637393 RepID=A0ABN3D7Q4_9MICO|nr:SIMPL domain-containing protein [Herbiconiux moechotypicola]MCS5728371.1 SIMPL domain-containing protein [Herbiconiux moechotypicola]